MLSWPQVIQRAAVRETALCTPVSERAKPCQEAKGKTKPTQKPNNTKTAAGETCKTDVVCTGQMRQKVYEALKQAS